MQGKQYILRQFIRWTAIVVCVQCVLAIVFGLRSYYMQSEVITLALENQAGKLEQHVSATIDYARYLLEHINSQIATRPYDITFIDQEVLSFKVKDPQAQKLFSPSVFSWVDDQLWMTVSSNVGKLKYPIDVSKRPYWIETSKRPGELLIAEPTGGYTSGEWVMPMAIGLANKYGKYIGTICVGLNIGRLTEKMEQKLSQEGISFTLVDRHDQSIITFSSNSKHIAPDFDPTLLPLPQDVSEGVLVKPSLFYLKPVVFFRHLPHYPYTIIVTYDNMLALRSLFYTLSLVVATFFVGVGAISFFFFKTKHHIVTPIVALSTAADQIVQRNETVSFPEGSVYEIDNLIAHVRKIEIYINNLKKTQRSLVERTFALQEALNAKKEFLNNMSHEMRISMTGLHVSAQELSKNWGHYSENDKQTLLRVMTEAGERAMWLMNNLFDMSKFQAEEVVIEMRAQSLEGVVEQVFHSMRPKVEAKGLSLVLEVTNISTDIAFDEKHIAIVITHLVDNAIRYSSAGTITGYFLHEVICYPDGRMLPGTAFFLEDEGQGVPEEEKDLIFEPFYQSSRTKTRAGGRGVGLALSAAIIQAHEGEIWVENNTLHPGCTFAFVLPWEQPTLRRTFSTQATIEEMAV